MKSGKIITFYSYKGGVGRSMALANIGVLLAQRGKRVLLVDWDLEAPGLEEYLRKLPQQKKKKRGGLLNVLQSAPRFDALEVEQLVTRFRLEPDGDLELLDSGSDTTEYAELVASFSWKEYFEERNGAQYLEQIREYWITKYDFVLIDSRTGITDSGGICTILMPDILVLLFAANNQNLNGILRVAKAARAGRETLEYPRLALSILPVPSRFDGRVEQRVSNDWLDRCANELEPYFANWLAPDVATRRLIEQLKVPYIPLYSFDEGLPVLDQSTTDPDQIGFYYNNLARLLANEIGPSLDEMGNHGNLLPKLEELALRFEARPQRAFISGTTRDLPEHRKEVMEACQRQGVFVSRVEDLPPYESTTKASLLKMVDDTDIYIGVFAHRYGYIPNDNNPEQISVTEMEYNRAVEMQKPLLIFVMDRSHPITIDQVETGEGASKLAAFLERVSQRNIVRFFKSPTDLRAEVINSLSQHLHEIARLAAANTASPSKSISTNFHYITAIPARPEIYVAHTYSLLQTRDLIGRRDELSLLTNWVAKPDSYVFNAHILSVTAIGGMGKSALTWKWFNDIAPEEMKSLAGRIWWSFSEPDSTFDNFVIHALAYATDETIEKVRQILPPDREAQLLSVLDHESYLIVLDGLERLLVAYARSDAPRLTENEVGSEKHFRKTADPRVGQFLRKLARIKQSRILLSTRLLPAELETAGGDPIPGVFNYYLEGLSDTDAVDFWRAFGVTGTRNELRPVFDAIERHPLLIQALTGEVKRFKRAPGDFAAWRAANPRFDPAAFPRVQDSMAHVMQYALQELSEKTRRVLEVIAAFRMPAGYETLTSILTGDDKPCGNELELDAVLVELEDRGLVGWDRRVNRYDLHPIVRGVVWSAMSDDTRADVYYRLKSHFEPILTVEKWDKVENLDDLAPVIELYHVVIGMGRYDDAYELFSSVLVKPLLWRLHAGTHILELLELLFPDGLDQCPRLNDLGAQNHTYLMLAKAYELSGRPGKAVPLYRRIDADDASGTDVQLLSGSLRNLSNTLGLTGASYGGENAVRRALVIDRTREDRYDEGVSLFRLGMALGLRGKVGDLTLALHRTLKLWINVTYRQAEGAVHAHLAQGWIWCGEFAVALRLAEEAWESALAYQWQSDFIRAARVRGEAALGLGDLQIADERLHYALIRARGVNMVDEELPALTALAELRRRQGDAISARELLNDVWEYAERGPYPLFHADALNVLTQIERDADNTVAAIEAATKAYRLAWCDGPPYAYHWGLIKAQKHLEELGAPLPEMPPFDESKFEPMPEVEIDPEDEFHVGATLSEDG